MTVVGKLPRFSRSSSFEKSVTSSSELEYEEQMLQLAYYIHTTAKAIRVAEDAKEHVVNACLYGLIPISAGEVVEKTGNEAKMDRKQSEMVYSADPYRRGSVLLDEV